MSENEGIEKEDTEEESNKEDGEYSIPNYTK